MFYFFLIHDTFQKVHKNTEHINWYSISVGNACDDAMFNIPSDRPQTWPTFLSTLVNNLRHTNWQSVLSDIGGQVYVHNPAVCVRKTQPCLWKARPFPFREEAGDHKQQCQKSWTHWWSVCARSRGCVTGSERERNCRFVRTFYTLTWTMSLSHKKCHWTVPSVTLNNLKSTNIQR